MIYRSIRLEQEGGYIITKYNPADPKILNILMPNLWHAEGCTDFSLLRENANGSVVVLWI